MITHTFDPNNIISLRSNNPEYIQLPYRWEEATEQEQENILAIVADCRLPRRQKVASIDAFIGVNIGKRGIFTTLDIKITSSSGKVHSRSVAAEIHYSQAENIVQNFISAGLPGLDRENADRIAGNFNRYLEHDRIMEARCNQIFAALKAGQSVDDIIDSIKT